MNDVVNIISLMIKTFHAKNDVRLVSYFESCFTLAISSLRPVIFLTLKFSFGLSNLEPGFYLNPSVSSVLDGLSIDISFGKRF